MTNKLGVYWSVMHRRPQDYEYFKRLQPSVFKIMDGGPNDYRWAKDNLPNSLIVARDWAMSEQHSDMLKDPIATGIRHAEEWSVHQRHLGFDPAKTLILGINEPHVWESGVPEALRLYTIALCSKATELGLRVGAMQLSVGWPGNHGPDTPPDWSPWQGVEAAIKRNNGALVTHEYWADKGPLENWGWWAGRTLKCPWQVPIVIGECGVDMYVKDASVAHNARGWNGRIDADRYGRELAEYTARMSADPRFVGCAVFAADFASREWWSFDIEPAYRSIVAALPLIALLQPTQPTTTPVTTHLPSVGTGEPMPSKVPPLAHPIEDPAKRIISQRFGDNPAAYARFNMAGHNGLDFAVPVGTPIRAVDDGVAVEMLSDLDGYGQYLKIRHSWGESLYAHLDRYHAVAQGAHVKRGQTIGLSGNSGNSTGPHLHLGIRINPYTRGAPYDGYSDPEPLLAGTVEPSKPQPTTDIPTLIKSVAADFGLEWQLLASLAWAESSFNRVAVSSSGALGLLQLMPGTFAEWKDRVGASDPLNARDNVRTGCAYLAWLVRYLNGDVRKALWAWNFGIGNISEGRTPPAETIEFASKVIFGRDLLKAIGA